MLDFLQQRHGKSADGEGMKKKKITLKRKSTSEIKLGGVSRSGGRSVNVEVRKKRTFVKLNPAEEAAVAAEKERKKAEEEKAIEDAKLEQQRIEEEAKQKELQEQALQEQQEKEGILKMEM